MEKTAFSPADILLPHDCGLTKWAVVACDQYTSQPEYWERVDQYVGDAPSTLRLILPESKLESDNVDEEIRKINATMEQYLQEERLRPVEDAMIFVERKLANGKTRLGLLGKLDLEEYSYEKGSGTPIRATEGTVLSRIPPRMKVRENAPIELPHIMVLIDDPDKKIIEPLTKDVNRKQMSKIYSATLMENGGRITGSLLSKYQAKKIQEALAELGDPQRFEEFYHAPGKPVLTYAMGDGNHSLATAKACWEKLKPTLSPQEQETHPARYALVELVNPTTTPWSLSPSTGWSLGWTPKSCWPTCWPPIPAPTPARARAISSPTSCPGSGAPSPCPTPPPSWPWAPCKTSWTATWRKTAARWTTSTGKTWWSSWPASRAASASCCLPWARTSSSPR